MLIFRIVTFKAYLDNLDVRVELNQSLVFENKLQTGSAADPFSFTYHDEIPDELWLYDVFIAAGERVCYEASETIILAGDDTWFAAEADAAVPGPPKIKRMAQGSQGVYHKKYLLTFDTFC